MRIKNAVFIKSVASSDILKDLPEIAFCGRSNVGKSSLINALCGQNKLAKTSSVPGKTRLINYFGINNKTFYFVDLPGYGYHKAGKEFEKKWATFIENYFKKSKNLKLCMLLMDINVPSSVEDKEMITYLSYNLIPFVIIATKSDKIAKSKVHNSVLALASELKVGTENIIPISSSKKMNLDKVLDLLERFLSQENYGDN